MFNLLPNTHSFSNWYLNLLFLFQPKIFCLVLQSIQSTAIKMKQSSENNKAHSTTKFVLKFLKLILNFNQSSNFETIMNIIKIIYRFYHHHSNLGKIFQLQTNMLILFCYNVNAQILETILYVLPNRQVAHG